MTTEEIMEQAQVFAIAWCRAVMTIDSGDALRNANKQSQELTKMIIDVAKEREEYRIEADNMAAAHKLERDELTAKVAALESRVDLPKTESDELDLEDDIPWFVTGFGDEIPREISEGLQFQLEFCGGLRWQKWHDADWWPYFYRFNETDITAYRLRQVARTPANS